MQEMYEDDETVWHDILRLSVEDLASVQYTGILLEGGSRLYPIVLGNKGDWSYLASQLAHFQIVIYICSWVCI